MSTDIARGHGDDRPLYTIYLPVAGVALLTEAKAPENPIWVEEKRVGDAFVLPLLAKGPDGAEGGDLDKD
ncbi:hypothetical protein Tco_0362400 [Tanacetum coccineum]